MDTMGKRIAFYRKRKKIQQKELAHILNLKSDGTVSQWEADITSPKPAMMLELCKVLNISISELFGVEENKGLTKEEEKLLASYKDLNEEGQKQAKDYFDYLDFKYNKKSSYWRGTKGSKSIYWLSNKQKIGLFFFAFFTHGIYRYF